MALPHLQLAIRTFVEGTRNEASLEGRKLTKRFGCVVCGFHHFFPLHPGPFVVIFYLFNMLQGF